MGIEEFTSLCIYILATVLGLCIGSFLNVVIYRLPREMSLASPPSHCPGCKNPIKWYDNVPVISYIALGGRCRKCKMRISPRYAIVELITGILWLTSALIYRDNLIYGGISAIILSTLICIFLIDLEHMLIFDRFNIIIGALGIISIFFDSYAPWYDHLIGAAAFGGLFLIIYLLSLFILGREGIGQGDVKLAFAAGMLLGWQKSIPALFLASVSASFILVIAKRVRGDERGTEYPFGPFLAVGIATSLLFGEPIINWYLSFMGF